MSQVLRPRHVVSLVWGLASLDRVFCIELSSYSFRDSGWASANKERAINSATQHAVHLVESLLDYNALLFPIRYHSGQSSWQALLFLGRAQTFL